MDLDQVERRKHRFAKEEGGSVLNAGNGVAVRDSGCVWHQTPGRFLCTICSGDANAFSEGRMMPRCSMWLNSSCAVFRFSGASRRGTLGTDTMPDIVNTWGVGVGWAVELGKLG